MSNKIALIFDFDDTLAHDSTTDFLKSIGINTHEFWKNKVEALMDDGWDPIPAYLYKMIDESKKMEPNNRITRDKLIAFGNHVRFFNGVLTLFSSLRKHVALTLDKQVELEFFLISSGIGDIVRHTPISKYFTDIWSSEFYYNKKAEIEFPKRLMSFTDKTRYIFSISKGLIGSEFKNRPFDVNDKTKKFYVPFNQMIFVGDGLTDVPCFALLKKYGGIPIAVYDPDRKEKWQRALKFLEDGRVTKSVPSDYRKSSELYLKLIEAIDDIIEIIKNKA